MNDAGEVKCPPWVVGLCAAMWCAASALAASERGNTLKTIASQPSWIVRGSDVELAVTQLGGHMAPVTFYRNTDKPVQPYYISPWQEENLKLDVPVLVPLRGDFFCMPFGANQEACEGVNFPPHGETAGSKWTFVSLEKSGAATSLTLEMTTKIRPGKVTKRLSLVDGQNVVYCRHVLEGFSLKTPLGHHATLAVGQEEGSLRIATSEIQFGMTCPVLFSDPANREYQSFAVNKKFQDLRHVPLLWKDCPEADCTSFPARTGFTDLLAIFSRKSQRVPAWTAATNQQGGYLWFSLKDPAVLPSTVFWISNRGRHGQPWNGRNRCLGLEDVCGYFAEGIAPSARPNLLTEAGIPTSVELSPERPTAVNHIQGVVKVPPGFNTVETVEFAPGKVTFLSATGQKVAAAVNHEFLWSGRL